MKPKKNSTVGFNNKILWGGYTFTKSGYTIGRGFSEKLIGALFSRQHWERKLSLRGLYEEFPSRYTRLQHRIAFICLITFGYELFRGDYFYHFHNCGVRVSEPIRENLKSHVVEDLLSPATNLPLQLDFFIPMVVFKGRSVPHKMAKDFSIKRKSLYKKNQIYDSSLYRYSNPRLEYNKRDLKVNAPVPGWADALYAALYNCTTGIITYGLSPEELLLAAKRQTFAKNPFEARSKGGYSILTKYRMRTCPTEEGLESAEILGNLEHRELDRIRRADLFPHAQQGFDPMFFNDELIELRHRTYLKRKRSIISSSHQSWEDYVDRVHKKLFTAINEPDRNPMESLIDLLGDNDQYINKNTVEVDLSDHGLEEGDDDYYEAILDEIDLNI